MPKVYAIDGVIPVVHPSAYVHSTAVLIGDVIVGPDCYVAPGASLRGDIGPIVMEKGSNFQDNCSAHCFSGGSARIMEYASVGHGAVLHGCVLEPHALVGMNAVVLDEAVIGERSIVGASALVRNRFKVPPRSLAAGVPAKVMRELTQAELDWASAGTNEYLELVRRSRASMELVEALTESDAEGPRIVIDGAKPIFEARDKR